MQLKHFVLAVTCAAAYSLMLTIGYVLAPWFGWAEGVSAGFGYICAALFAAAAALAGLSPLILAPQTMKR